MTPEEEARLVDEIARLLATSQLTRDAAIAAVSDVIAAAYAAGLDADPSMPAVVDPLISQQSLTTATTSMSRRVGHIWDAMDTDIIDTVTGAIKRGESYDDAMSRLDTLISDKWGKAVPFDNRGNTVRQVDITPDGKMSWSDHTITRPISFATDAYAENISRTVVHESWSTAHHDQYKSIGLPGYIYRSVRDAATRPTHLALHGTRIRYGTPEDEMAQAVMAEYGCRCTPGPWFDDPEYDTPEEVDEAETIKAAKKAREHVEEGTEEATFLDQIILQRKPFEDATDHTELRQMIEVKWPDTTIIADVEGLDLDATKKTLGAISSAARDYPGVTRNIYKLGDQVQNPDDYALIRYATGGTGIPKRPDVILVFNKDMYSTGGVGNLTAAVRRDKAAKYHPSGKVESAGLHEFGHMVEVGIAYRLQQPLHVHATNTVSKAARNLLKREPTEEELKNMCKSISEYAARDPRETIAEAFADVYANADKSQPISREIVALIRNEWNLL